MKIKTTMKYHYTAIRMVEFLNTDNKYWQACGAKQTLICCW